MMSNLRKVSEWRCRQLSGLVSTMPVDLWNRGLHDACICIMAWIFHCLTTLLLQHIQKGNEDGLFISSVASSSNLWALIMDAGTGFTSQVYELSNYFLHKVNNQFCWLQRSVRVLPLFSSYYNGIVALLLVLREKKTSKIYCSLFMIVRQHFTDYTSSMMSHCLLHSGVLCCYSF